MTLSKPALIFSNATIADDGAFLGISIGVAKSIVSDLLWFAGIGLYLFHGYGIPDFPESERDAIYGSSLPINIFAGIGLVPKSSIPLFINAGVWIDWYAGLDLDSDILDLSAWKLEYYFPGVSYELRLTMRFSYFSIHAGIIGGTYFKMTGDSLDNLPDVFVVSPRFEIGFGLLSDILVLTPTRNIKVR